MRNRIVPKKEVKREMGEKLTNGWLDRVVLLFPSAETEL